MSRVQKHLRNTFLTGIFAATPLAITIFAIVYVEDATRAPIYRLLGINIPFIGVAVAIALIYALGLLVNSLLGRWLISLVDRLLLRVPVLKELYSAWKHISVTPGGKEGIFAKVVLVPLESNRALSLGFSSGGPIDGDPNTCCVFVPAAPNPMNGRLYFVPIADVRFLSLSPEEAFKIILSGGNYVPAELSAVSAPSKQLAAEMG
jgi:uncharacterized membrane protein